MISAFDFSAVYALIGASIFFGLYMVADQLRNIRWAIEDFVKQDQKKS